jgi:hypothetical protein
MTSKNMLSAVLNLKNTFSLDMKTQFLGAKFFSLNCGHTHAQEVPRAADNRQLHLLPHELDLSAQL